MSNLKLVYAEGNTHNDLASCAEFVGGLKTLEVGESVQMRGFPSMFELRHLAGLVLNSLTGSEFIDREYRHEIHEPILEYYCGRRK